MKAKFIFILLCLLSTISIKAQDTFSPQLNEFLENHSTASCILSNEVRKAQASSGNRIAIFYFYTYNETTPTAHHNKNNDGPEVAIFIRGGRPAIDEYLDFLFEVLNMSGDKRFQELFQQARSDGITRSNFVSEILRQEFQAMKTLRQMVPTLKFSPQEIAGSRVYNDLTNAPTDFGEFLSYTKKSNHVQEGYEQYYDTIHGSLHEPNPPTNKNDKLLSHNINGSQMTNSESPPQSKQP